MPKAARATSSPLDQDKVARWVNLLLPEVAQWVSYIIDDPNRGRTLVADVVDQHREVADPHSRWALIEAACMLAGGLLNVLRDAGKAPTMPDPRIVSLPGGLPPEIVNGTRDSMALFAAAGDPDGLDPVWHGYASRKCHPARYLAAVMGVLNMTAETTRDLGIRAGQDPTALWRAYMDALAS